MNIHVSDIEAAIYGAEQVLVKNSGWIAPNRFSHAQLRSFEKKPDVEMDFGREHFLSRTVATAGVTLDFVTDSISLSFEYRIFSASNSVMCYFDVFVNDHLYCHAGKAGQSWAAGRVSLQLLKGEKRVTVYFPCLHKGEIRNLSIDDGAQFAPVFEGKEHQKILFLGDSITQGFTTAYPSLTYSNIFTRAMHAECLNQAVGGDIFDEVELDVTPSFVPDMILVAYGTNDWYWRRDIEASALAYYRKLTNIYPKTRIFALLPIWRGDTEGLELLGRRSFMEHRAVIRNVCEHFSNVSVIDTIDFVPHETDFFEDQVLHPNELGFMMYAEALQKKLPHN